MIVGQVIFSNEFYRKHCQFEFRFLIEYLRFLCRAGKCAQYARDKAAGSELFKVFIDWAENKSPLQNNAGQSKKKIDGNNALDSILSQVFIDTFLSLTSYWLLAISTNNAI